MPTRLSFEVNTLAGNIWSCPIACQQCTYLRPPNNARCRNRVCFGSPLCWQHNKITYGVKARPSTIQGAGKGLFATRQFHPQNNPWICPMICEDLPFNCVDHQRYPGATVAPYAERRNQHRIVDCACSRGIGSQANARFYANGNIRPLSQHNAITRLRPTGPGGQTQIWLKATRIIHEDQEIFMHYGNQFSLVNNHTTRRRKTVADSRPC